MFVPAKTKAEAVARIYEVAGVSPEPLGPGSKEKRSVLERLAEVVGVDPTECRTKVAIGESIALRLGCAWDDDHWSAGDTITLSGLNHLLAAASEHGEPVVPSGSHEPARSRSGDEVTIMYPDFNDHSKREAMTRSPLTDHLATLHHSIAEGLARLSQAPVWPVETDSVVDHFRAADVHFEDGSWRARLLEVEPLLYLPTTLDREGGPERFSRSLAANLAVGGDESALLDEGELTVTGLEALHERLDRAAQHLENFQEALDSEGGSREAAAADWVDAWQEADEAEVHQSVEPIRAKSEVKPIHELVDQARDDELNLTPPYQRGDVWPTPDAQRLMESILRGIPLPSIILLRREIKGRTIYDVVDGKQRLTAILRFVGAHPKALERVRAVQAKHPESNLLHLFENDYVSFKKEWKFLEGETLTAGLERDYYFPFPLRSTKKAFQGPLEPLAGKYFCEIADQSIPVVDGNYSVKSLFKRTTDYKLPVIEYTRATPSQIHEVFNLYNKQGKHLNAEEIRNALYQELDLMKSLLAVAGDTDNVDEVAPLLTSVWAELADAADTLESLNFGTARFKRTKVLSWVAAALLLDGVGKRSTAASINALLDREADTKTRQLSKEQVVDLMVLLGRAIDVHQMLPDMWAERFQNTSGKPRWEELPLVASLVGMTAAAAVLGDELAVRVEDAYDTLQQLSASPTWRRPAKTQTAVQWDYTARVAVGLLEALGTDPEEAHRALVEGFGQSGLESLAERTGVGSD